MVAEKYEVSKEKLPFIQGQWNNKSINQYDYYTLWECLTTEKAPLNSFVGLDFLDQHTLLADLFLDGVNIKSHKIKIKQRESWFELPTQYIAHPFLWYIIWGWGNKDIALGITANDNLWVNSVGNGSIMILFLPTFGGGNDTGTVGLYERVKKEGK